MSLTGGTASPAAADGTIAPAFFTGRSEHELVQETWNNMNNITVHLVNSVFILDFIPVE
jgi:hypothetical protein